MASRVSNGDLRGMDRFRLRLLLKLASLLAQASVSGQCSDVMSPATASSETS